VKRASKIIFAFAGIAAILGILLWAAGAVMGGQRELNAAAEENGQGALHLGGEHGFYIDRQGIHIGNNILDRDDDDDPVEAGDGTVVRDGNSITSSGLVAFTSLDVELMLGDVFVEEGEDYSICLTWNVPTAVKGFEMFYKSEDSKLTVWTEDSDVKMPDGKSWNSSAIITIPKGADLDEVDISTDLGDVSWSAAATAREVNLSTDLGDVTCSGVTAQDLKAESDLGNVTLYLPNGREFYRWELETNMGDLTVDGETQAGGIGSISNQGGSGRNSVEASTALGDVEVYFSQSA